MIGPAIEHVQYVTYPSNETFQFSPVNKTRHIPIKNEPPFERMLSQYFQNIPRKELNIKSLDGGFSDAKIILIEHLENKYIGKQSLQNVSTKDFLRDVYAMRKASKLNLGPAIRYVGRAQHCVLLDYIEGDTSTIDQGKKNCKQLAKAIKTIHKTPKNPYPRPTFLKMMERSASFLSDTEQKQQAMEIIRSGLNEVSLLDFKKVNIHGDLNPRNIFIQKEGISLIDWSDTNWEDPFLDLTILSIFYDYTQEEEALLLEEYLEKPPSLEEQRHYDLIKKVSWAAIFISISSIVELSYHPISFETEIPLKPWNYYASYFAENSKDTSLQFLYELGLASLNKALEQP